MSSLVVSKEGIVGDLKKSIAIMEREAPRNVDEVRSFMVLAGYYRRFIVNHHASKVLGNPTIKFLISITMRGRVRRSSSSTPSSTRPSSLSNHRHKVSECKDLRRPIYHLLSKSIVELQGERSHHFNGRR